MTFQQARQANNCADVSARNAVGSPVTRKPVYVAHALNAPTAGLREQNRARAAAWCGWLSRRYLIAPVADWIVLSSVWDETAENRALGLECDKVLVELCGTIVLVGPHVSEGMKLEIWWAKTVVDLTGIREPIDTYWGRDAQLMTQVFIDARMAEAGIARVELSDEDEK